MRHLSRPLPRPVFQLLRAMREPRRLARLHYSSVLAGLHSLLEGEEAAALRKHFEIDAQRFAELEHALVSDTAFTRAVESAYSSVRECDIRLLGSTPAEDHEAGLRMLYYLTRLLEPARVVETGVFDGFSSAFILKALRDNGHGHLYSIDFPARRPVDASTNQMFFDCLPTGHHPGWLVPQPLRDRWTLRLGTSQTLLEGLLKECGEIDLFFHDSLHTHETMLWEYQTAWPRISDGGLLVSDDVFWSRAFWSFAANSGREHTIHSGLGVVRKPEATVPRTAFAGRQAA